MIFLPREVDGRKFHPHGLIAGFGGGVTYTMSSRLLVTFELGYQLGYQGTLAYGRDVTYQDDLLHLAFGLITPLR